jgi:CDP-glycerol glycerophosphotransferase
MSLFRNNGVITLLSQSATALLAWLFLFPLTRVVPRRKNRFLVIGRNSKYFTDNAKHFFLFLTTLPQTEAEPVFLTRDRATHAMLREAGLATVFFPGWQAMFQLLTAEYIVVDNGDWIEQGKFQLSRGAGIIQLWHGAPLKEIELPLRDRTWQKLPGLLRFFLRIQKIITGRYSQVDFLISTSEFFTDQAFKTAFHSRRVINTGYPRNDAILRCRGERKMTDPVWLNTDQAIISRLITADTCQQTGQLKKVLYAPTFRNSMASPFTQNILDLTRLDRFAEKNSLLFVMKLHPLMAETLPAGKYQNILCYAPLADIYPALSLFDVLITDYSSIYFDFLLLDRPLIFFSYDYDAYLREDRRLLFDYQQMAPGMICSCQQEVEQALLRTARDDFTEKRKEVQRLVFDDSDCKASQRIWQAIRDRRNNDIER